MQTLNKLKRVAFFTFLWHGHQGDSVVPQYPGVETTTKNYMQHFACNVLYICKLSYASSELLHYTPRCKIKDPCKMLVIDIAFC